jgi:hypothetical protein
VVEVIAGLDDIMVAADSERGGGQEQRGGGAVSGEGKGQHSTLRCTPTIAAIGGECRWLGARAENGGAAAVWASSFGQGG